MEFKGLLFDVYKTLIDIKADENSITTYEPVSRWLAYHGVLVSPKDLMHEYKWRAKRELENHGMFGEIKVEEIFAQICREKGSWPLNDLTVGMEAARVFRSASIRKLQPFPQSVRLLEKLRGYPKGVISNGQRVFSEAELKQTGFFWFFNFVVFSSDVGYQKPDDRIYIIGMDLLHLQPHEILFIGDSWRNDIEAPRRLGMQSMHIEEAWRYFQVL